MTWKMLKLLLMAAAACLAAATPSRAQEAEAAAVEVTGEALAPGVPEPLLAGKVVVTALIVPLNAWLYGAWVFKD